MFVTVLLTYGVTAPSVAACLGIGASLLLAALGATLAVHAAHLDGRSTELATYLAGTGDGLPLITASIELMLAARAAHLQRERTLDREPSPWPASAPRHTADTTAEASGRPITATLMDF